MSLEILEKFKIFLNYKLIIKGDFEGNNSRNQMNQFVKNIVWFLCFDLVGWFKMISIIYKYFFIRLINYTRASSNNKYDHHKYKVEKAKSLMFLGQLVWKVNWSYIENLEKHVCTQIKM